MNGRIAGRRPARRPSGSLLKPVLPDEKLSEITGGTPQSRSELIKRLWNYIRKNGLQDGKRKMLIHADEKLRAIFNGKPQVTMLELTALVLSHVIALGPEHLQR
jgi:chromatin remodeling complex protein RSC6